MNPGVERLGQHFVHPRLFGGGGPDVFTGGPVKTHRGGRACRSVR